MGSAAPQLLPTYAKLCGALSAGEEYAAAAKYAREGKSLAVRLDDVHWEALFERRLTVVDRDEHESMASGKQVRRWMHGITHDSHATPHRSCSILAHRDGTVRPAAILPSPLPPGVGTNESHV